MPARLPETVAAFCGRHALLAGGGVVAVSGGADSVCLAKLLCDLQRQGQFSKLVLAHLNHQLRGTDSDADEAFVLALGRQWELPVRTSRVDVASAAKSQGANLEETARRLRYEWLTHVARAERCAWVATGHTADDQAETVLHRLLRGSGLQGLAAMAAQRPLEEGIALVRPLLGTQRSQVVTYLAHEKQEFREDSSNQDLRFTRNRLRHELLPLLVEQFNPGIVDVLCRLADQAGAVQQEIAAAAAQLLEGAELPRASNTIVLNSAQLAKASRHLRRELFRLIWQREGWPMGQMSYEAWDRLANLTNETNAAVDLPAGVRARRTRSVVQLERESFTE